MNKTALSTYIGNIVEFYDLILFAYLSIYLGKAFFPQYEPSITLLMTFGAFIGGCFMRPMAVFCFGLLGDRFGRKPLLKISILIATIGSTTIAFLPTYEQVGLLAPCLLIFFRLCQGFSISGEQPGAAVYLIESKQKNQAGYASSLIFSSIFAGIALGAGIIMLVTWVLGENMATYGWRVPFLLAAPLGFLAYFLRIQSEESPVFEKLKLTNQVNKNPFITLFKTHKIQIMHSVFMCAPYALAIYLFAVYFPSNLQKIFDEQTHVSLLILAVSILTALFCPLLGKLSDRFGHSLCYKISMLVFLLSLPLIVVLIHHPTFLTLTIGYLLLGVMCATLAGPLFALLASSYQDDIRVSGVTLTFNLSMTIFGATAPLIAIWLSEQPSDFSMLPLQLFVVLFIGYFGLKLSRRNKPVL